MFERLLQVLIHETTEDKIFSELSLRNLIIVHHLLPTHVPFFRYLIKTFNKVTIIAIPYSLDLNAKDALSAERVTIETPPSLQELTSTLRRWISEFSNTQGQKCLIFEVGGYSCEILTEQVDEVTRAIEGIVEDTEHGLRLHENQLHLGKMWWKVFSVARSPLKVAEDALTGDAVVYSLEKQLRSMHQTLNLKNVVVLGFGKIGKYLSLSLKTRKTNVYVYDTDPYKQLEAYSLGFEIRSREETIRYADIIIGATGNTSVGKDDFTLMKDGVLLASASSKTVEIDLEGLKRQSIEVNKTGPYIDAYTMSSAKKVYLINGGAPINFIDMGIIGLPLELVWVECVFCLLEIIKSAGFGIFNIEDSIRTRIAQAWVDTMIAGS
jgi:adenosylhomocysteinase